MPMRSLRSILALLAGGFIAVATPAGAQYPPYPGPGQPTQPPGPPARGQFAHACFPADQNSGFLRVEWPQSGRWAIFNWPFGSNLRIYIGPEPAQWCWSRAYGEVARPCRPAFTQPVQPGC